MWLVFARHQVRGARDQDEWYGLNLAYNVVRAARFVAPEGDIGTLFDEINRGIAQHELDTHLRARG